jgi:hypothetical protein
MARSVRQGCLLAPLIFLFAFDVFDHMVSLALSNGQLKGLHLEEHNMTLCQDFYADNTTLCIVAERANVDFSMKLADDFGSLSGLYCQWKGMCATFIGADHIPDEFVDLEWKWETPGNYSKLLGLHFGKGIDGDMMASQVTAILEDRLRKSKMNPTSLAARLVIIKQLLLSSVWYFLTLWSSTEMELKCLEQKMVRFLWARQKDRALHRVNYQTIIKPRAQGGLGYISITQQVDSLASRLILWAISAGEDDLKTLLRQRIMDLS